MKIWRELQSEKKSSPLPGKKILDRLGDIGDHSLVTGCPCGHARYHAIRSIGLLWNPLLNWFPRPGRTSFAILCSISISSTSSCCSFSRIRMAPDDSTGRELEKVALLAELFSSSFKCSTVLRRPIACMSEGLRCYDLFVDRLETPFVLPAKIITRETADANA